MGTSFVFIDSQVADIDSLLAGIPSGAEVVIINGASVGLNQIVASLQGRTGIDAIHIISHGSSGSVSLGGGVMDAALLFSHAGQLEAIGNSLTESGDILLYGCTVGAGQTGRQFIEALAALTGADVAASDDATGGAASGGDWLLEAHTSAIEGKVFGNDAYAATLAANTAPVFLATGNGRLITDFGGLDNAAGAVTLQVDGKIVVAGRVTNAGGNWDFAVARYNSDGSLDTAFGDGGRVITDFGGRTDNPTAVAVQADGKIVVAGSVAVPMTNSTATYTEFALARYNSDGSLDSTFSGDGTLTTRISVNNNAVAKSLVFQPGGTILVGGYAYNGSNNNFTLVSYNSDGSLDMSFGGDGIVITDTTGRSDYINAITLQSDGKIVAAGYGSMTGQYSDFILARYNIDGALDISFDGDGLQWTSIGVADDVAVDVAVQADGRIVAAGYSSNQVISVVSYNVNGTLDTTFDLDGKLTIEIGSGQNRATSVSVQPDGSIVIGGYSFVSSNNGFDFSLARLGSDGSLDSSFDDDGKLTADFGGAGHDYGTAAVLQPDGRIVVAGYRDNLANSTENDFALVRFNSDGSLDTSFDGDTLGGNIIYTRGSAPVVLAHSLEIDDKELNLLSGGAGAYRGASLILARKGGANAGDLFGFDSSANFIVSGNSLTTSGGSTFATFASDNGTLTLTFDSYATRTLVNDVLERITYSGTSQASPTPVEIVWTFNDGNTASQGTGGALSANASSFVSIVNAAGLIVTGTNGNDTLIGGAGNDTLDGGSGTDTAAFSGNLAAYTLTRTGSTFTVRANSGSDGTDTLTNIERLQFADAKIALDITGNKNACLDTSGLANAGQVYRLYEAMFNRAPDQAGLAYWIGQADISIPLTTIATTFASGQEYRNKYGNLSDHAFIDQLYLNVLGRPGEAAGTAYWYGQLDTAAMSREQVLVGFSESTENQAAVIGVIQNGIDFTI